MFIKEALERFGKKVEAEREQRGMTQEYLAHYLGESLLYIQLLEKGRIDSRISEMDKIAEAFGMSFFELVAGVA